MSISVDVIRDTDDQDVPGDQQFLDWVKLAVGKRRLSGEVCIRIVDESESQTLNSEYRGKDKPTNVLSFPFEAPPGVPVDILGDLAICAPVVAREAAEQQKQPTSHWAHLVIHGTLHLLGFDHINDEDAEEMEQLETELLAQIGIDDPYR